MSEIDYVEEVKKSAKNIDFDKPTRKLFEDYINFNNSGAKKLLDFIKNSNRENFIKINPEEVENILIGNLNPKIEYTEYYMYLKDKDGAILEFVPHSFVEVDYDNVKFADLKNDSNFAKQFLNLVYAFGGEIIKGTPDMKKHHYLINVKGENYHLTNNETFLMLFNAIYNRYLWYNLSIYYRKILEKKSEKELERLINKSEISKKIYNHSKNLFDDFDFLYAIIAYLDNEKAIEIFNKCIDKNESYINHFAMDEFYIYLDTASSFIFFEIPKRVIFLQDIAERICKKSAIAKELFIKMTSIYDKKMVTIQDFLSLHTLEEQQEMLDFLNSGETDIRKIKHKLSDIITKHL